MSTPFCKRESRWTSDTWLNKLEAAGGSPTALGRKPTRSHRAQESQEPGHRISEQRGTERPAIGDTPDPLSCPPTEEGKSIFCRNWPKRQRAQQSVGLGMELEAGLEEDSILKDEIPQLLVLAQLRERQQPGLYPSPAHTRQKNWFLCVEDIQPKRKQLTALVFGVPQWKWPVPSGLSYSRANS